MRELEIVPAILEKDFSGIKKKLKQAEPYFKKVQIDFGDSKFVPETFIEVKDFKAVKTKLKLEAHLMTEKPWKLFDDLVKLGFQKATFHYEAFFGIQGKRRVFAINNLINKIKEFKLKAGIALNPETNAYHLTDYVDKVDEVLLLGVNPGKQGQKFQKSILEKINFLRNFKETLEIGIDGGVNDKNIREIAKAGANKVYIGSYLWEGDIDESIRILTNKVRITN